MLADGFLSPIDTVRAKLQEQIGYFLSSRAILMRLMDNSSLSIQSQARGYYTIQTQLETKLQNEITPKLTAISNGVWDSSDILTLAGFTYQLMNQISGVNGLQRQAGGNPVGFFESMDMSTVALGGIILLGLGITSGIFFGRRQQV